MWIRRLPVRARLGAPLADLPTRHHHSCHTDAPHFTPSAYSPLAPRPHRPWNAPRSHARRTRPQQTSQLTVHPLAHQPRPRRARLRLHSRQRLQLPFVELEIYALQRRQSCARPHLAQDRSSPSYSQPDSKPPSPRPFRVAKHGPARNNFASSTLRLHLQCREEPSWTNSAGQRIGPDFKPPPTCQSGQLRAISSLPPTRRQRGQRRSAQQGQRARDPFDAFMQGWATVL